jgi:NAD(P)-dependent dehydrogenase (short-subunit alcohol dehydrogenase family)
MPVGIEPELAGRVAVITGAGRGIGLAAARRLAQHGATVVIADLDDGRGRAAAHTLAGERLSASFQRVDVADPGLVEEVAQRVGARYGRLDIWVNNAGLAQHGPSEKVSSAAWQLSIGVMLSGTFYGCQSAGRIMMRLGGGAIINVASVNGLVAQSGRAAYCAAKAGVIRLTEVLASEWAPHRIRVNAIAPSVFPTDLVVAALKAGAASMDGYVRRTPARRLGDLEELADVFLYLASDQSSYVTGQTLRVDGGWGSDHYL